MKYFWNMVTNIFQHHYFSSIGQRTQRNESKSNTVTRKCRRPFLDDYLPEVKRISLFILKMLKTEWCLDRWRNFWQCKGTLQKCLKLLIKKRRLVFRIPLNYERQMLDIFGSYQSFPTFAPDLCYVLWTVSSLCRYRGTGSKGWQIWRTCETFGPTFVVWADCKHNIGITK